MIDRLLTLSPSLQWGLLLVSSILLGVLFAWGGIPAALLLGPMLAGMVLSIAGVRLTLPRRPFIFAQGVIGCMIAKILPGSVSVSAFGHWPLFMVGVMSVIFASFFLAWVMARWKILPGTTSVWGLSPGAATVMTLMAELHGADIQLVAFMQYLRVIMAAAVASTVARLCGIALHHTTSTISWFAPIAWEPFIETLGLIVGSVLLAHRLRFRTGALLIPLILGTFLTYEGWMTIELPRWFLAIAYAFVGWRIGLQFTRHLLMHAAKTLPRIVLGTAVLIGTCGVLGLLLALVAHIDPLTAYLATSPGGADTVAIIAASSHVDVPFVMSMQIARFVTVLFLGPPIARFVAKRFESTNNQEVKT